MTTRLRNYFFAGVLVVAPTAVSIWLLYKGFFWLDSLLGGFIQKLTIFGYEIPGLGLVTVVAIIVCIGFLSTGYFGKSILHLWERLVSAIPLMNRLYPVVKQIGGAFLAEQERAFREPVLIEYPRRGMYSLAFATKAPPPVIQKHVEEDLISVFLPTTPNPTSGFLLIVPKREIRPLQMSVEEAIKLVISGGVVAPAKDGTLTEIVVPQLAAQAGGDAEVVEAPVAVLDDEPNDATPATASRRRRSRRGRGARGGRARAAAESVAPERGPEERGPEERRPEREERPEPSPERKARDRRKRRRW